VKRKKTLLCLLIVTAFIIPLIGNSALSEERSTEKTVWFYFDNYDQFHFYWSDPGEMVDGDPDDYAFTTTDGQEELCNSINCSGYGSGTIMGVDIAVKGYYTRSYRDIILQPRFGEDLWGDNHIFDDVPANSGDWSDWFDVTDDNNTHEWWTWSNVQDLDVKVIAGTDGTAFDLFCSMVKIRVTYEEIP